KDRVSCWRRPARVSLGTRTVTSIPAFAMSIPAARSANSGSSSTSCIGSSYDEKAVTGVAVRGSCGQPEIWSAGSKHHVTALENSSQRSGFNSGSSPPRDDDVSGRPRLILRPPSPQRGQFPAPVRPHPLTPAPATARQQPQPATTGQPGNFHAVTASPGHQRL